MTCSKLRAAFTLALGLGLCLPTPSFAASVSVPANGQAPASIDGTSLAALNDAATITSLAAGSCVTGLSGTFSLTITFEVWDGTNWSPINALQPNSATASTTATAKGSYKSDVSSYRGYRARVSAYTSGSASAYLNCTTLPA